MAGEVKDPWVRGKEVLSALAVVHVKVQDENLFGAVDQGVVGGQGNVVTKAESWELFTTWDIKSWFEVQVDLFPSTHTQQNK